MFSWCQREPHTNKEGKERGKRDRGAACVPCSSVMLSVDAAGSIAAQPSHDRAYMHMKNERLTAATSPNLQPRFHHIHTKKRGVPYMVNKNEARNTRRKKDGKETPRTRHMNENTPQEKKKTQQSDGVWPRELLLTSPSLFFTSRKEKRQHEPSRATAATSPT